MKQEDKNKSLLTRREFFKKAAKGTLPFIAAITVPSFFSSCGGGGEEDPINSGCDGCSNTCEGVCQESCSIGCKESCVNSSGNSSSCSDCSANCSGGCKEECSNTCKNGAKKDDDSDNKDNHTAVDLGLGALWATCNYGASSEEDFGTYVCWADPSGEKLTSNEVDYYSTSNPPRNISGTQYDVARMQWKNGWRIPTQNEAQELINKCSWKFETLKGIPGQRITGPNGKSIFLPLAGYYYQEKAYYIKEAGDYWTATADTKPSYDINGNKLPIRSAFVLNFGTNNGNGTANNSLLFANSRTVIRPVKDSNNGCKDCASGCSSGCYTTCENSATSSNQGGGGSSGGENNSGCSTCENTCNSGCGSGCRESCGGSCSNNCQGDCRFSCIGWSMSVKNCSSTCYGTCNNQCDNTCKFYCYTTCQNIGKQS